MLLLREKYNLTIKNSHDAMKTEESFFSFIFWAGIFDLGVNHNPNQQIYWIEQEKFAFFVVTTRSETFDGFLALLSPLDALSWMATLISGLIVVAIPMLSSVSCEAKINKVLAELINNLFSVIGIFFNQTWGWSEVLKKSGLTLGCWSFASFILSDLYGEEIYSSLTAPSLPNVPNTLESLVESNLSTLTISYFIASYSGESHTLSVLRDKIIRDLIRRRLYPSSEHILENVRKQLVFKDYGNAGILAIKKFATQETFAVFDIPKTLSLVEKCVVHEHQVD